jgi:AraC family L-rhamnose operon regulatory protein RhaS
MSEFKEPITIGKEFHPGYKLQLYHDYNGSKLKEVDKFEVYSIIHVVEGIGYLNIGNLKVLVSAPCICYFNQKELPQLTLDSDLKYVALYFHPLIINNTFNYDAITVEFVNTAQDAYLLRPFVERNDSFKGIIRIDHSISKRISSLINDIGRELDSQKDAFWPCRSRSVFFELLILTGRLYDTRSKDKELILNNLNEDISDLIEYLHTNYHRKITIGELTKIYSNNRTTLNAQFKEATGCSIIEYLNYIRIQVACSLLRNTTLPVYDIYLRVGFKDDTNFLRMFKKHIKCSPSDYRQRHCWMIN